MSIRSAVPLLCLGLAACSVRLGGPSPEEYGTLAMEAPVSMTPAEAAALIRETGANIVLLTSPHDSTWFAQVASETGLSLSGPGRTGPMAMAFLANLEILGDTSIVLGVTDGTRLHMHDALYEISENRHLDLMLVGVQENSNLREAVRTLLGYIATDVGPNAAIMMAVDAPTPAIADSVAVLLRAAYTSANECASSDSQPANGGGSLQLFYGPPVRVRCESARLLPQPGTPVFARLIVGR